MELQVWIIGEYAERIDNADELLETFLDTFPEENSMVCCCDGQTTTRCRIEEPILPNTGLLSK
jgi:AP-1 complex subunit beta-1